MSQFKGKVLLVINVASACGEAFLGCLGCFLLCWTDWLGCHAACVGLGCGVAADPAVAVLPLCLQLLMRRCAGQRSGMRGVPCPS